MKLKNFAAIASVATIIAACAAQPMPAHAAEHPHYLHALSDLRMARALLAHPAEGNVMREESIAIEEIDHAIGEIRRASIDDGKDPNFRPPVDPALDYRGRLRRALELTEEARTDLAFEEDNFVALHWREAALHHVEEATGSIHGAIRAKHWDERR